MSFAAPWFLLGLLLIPVVIWLHFIRQAKRQRVVSALWLWSIDDAPQRKAKFNPNILLLLQILTVIFASLGAAAPSLQNDTRESIVILDASASMLAKDLENNTQTRLEFAKTQIAPLLLARITLIRAGLSATVVSGSTSTLETRQQALRSFAAGDASSDLENALALARSIAPRAKITVFSSQVAKTNFQGIWHQILGNGENIGITAFAIRGSQVFAALESNQARPITAKIRLSKDNKTILETSLKIPANARVTWTPRIQLSTGTYQLELPTTDTLALDNTAYAVVNSSRVLVSPPQDDVLKAVVSLPGVRTAARDTPPSNARGYDTVILVGAIPKALPDGNYLIFAPLPKATVPDKIERITRSDNTHPLLRFANLEGLRTTVSSLVPPEIPNGTWTPLVFAGTKGFIWYGSNSTVRAVYIAAHPLAGELRKFPAFPVLMYNILSEFNQAVSVPLGTRLGTDVTFQGNIATGFTRALLPGVYTSDGQKLIANLSSSQSTRLPLGTSQRLELGQQSENSNQNQIGLQPESVWRLPLLLLALLALSLEAIIRGGGISRVFSSVRSAT